MAGELAHDFGSELARIVAGVADDRLEATLAIDMTALPTAGGRHDPPPKGHMVRRSW